MNFALFHDKCGDGFKDTVFHITNAESMETAAHSFAFELCGKPMKSEKAIILTSESGERYMCMEE